ncbi:PQQ-dependent sugar dehydrogenase [Kibdelosporangium philippinense]|uniref:PQQ-dependent sugar dehydrogenase n=1 Tax=Kibdelosporangium philippinense TaxID=211113 RepID=A0ABS8ZAZ1_9PSEU|nr:glucose/sorbosone family PQQ-dependent dehydrogenase [Kibdelosporangium philippinense]MCE7003851.1 PQQ-dependent sugar dehydrogenase [Kibdelosporangium philippinense]
MRTPALVLAAALTATLPLSADAEPSSESGSFRVVATGLAGPYEITLGPDGMLWTTEKAGRRVLRIDPKTGDKHVAATIPDAVYSGQAGVLGMALRLPDVFVAYTHASGAKIVKFTYQDGQLRDPVDVIAGMPGGTDHQSARLVIGPDSKLYYTIGDQGANQFAQMCKPIEAQRLPASPDDRDAYRGKVLRLNLDGSIPADNPVLAGVRSHVYTYGHRNAQGLVFGPTGILYSSEQGPKTDDEVNIIARGKNYGWPHVAGHRDDKAYVYGNWSAAPDCADLNYDDFDFPSSVPQATESSWHNGFVPPIKTFYTVPSSHNFMDDKCADGEQWYICWPTVAPASLDYVNRSLLMPALKDGTVHRLRLSPDGTRVTSVSPLFRTVNRYRDTAVSSDGKTVYVATDNVGQTRDADGKPTDALANPGSILEFKLDS